jgi:hypothetical protein
VGREEEEDEEGEEKGGEACGEKKARRRGWRRRGRTRSMRERRGERLAGLGTTLPTFRSTLLPQNAGKDPAGHNDSYHYSMLDTILVRSNVDFNLNTHLI